MALTKKTEVTRTEYDLTGNLENFLIEGAKVHMSYATGTFEGVKMHFLADDGSILSVHLSRNSFEKFKKIVCESLDMNDPVHIY